MLHESTTLNYDLHAAKLLSNSLQTGRTRVVLDCPYTYHQDDYKTTARGFFTVPLNGAEVALIAASATKTIKRIFRNILMALRESYVQEMEHCCRTWGTKWTLCT